MPLIIKPNSPFHNIVKVCQRISSYLVSKVSFWISIAYSEFARIQYSITNHMNYFYVSFHSDLIKDSKLALLSEGAFIVFVFECLIDYFSYRKLKKNNQEKFTKKNPYGEL